jgi:hypothetical protein
MGRIGTRASSKCSSPGSSITTNDITEFVPSFPPLSNKKKENKEIVEILFTDPNTPLSLRGCASPSGDSGWSLATLFYTLPLHNTPTAPILTTSGFLLSVPILPGCIRLSLQTPGPASSRQILYVYTCF